MINGFLLASMCDLFDFPAMMIAVMLGKKGQLISNSIPDTGFVFDREWLGSWCCEINKRWVVHEKALLEQLPTAVSKDKKFDCVMQGLLATRETTRTGAQTSQIVTLVSLCTFDSVGFAFIFHWMMDSRPIKDRFVSFVVVTVVVMSLDTFF